jgi:FMN-dependent NADH-azoreductase
VRSPRAVVAHLKESNRRLPVTYRDLAAEPVPHLSGTYFFALQTLEERHDPALLQDLALGGKVLEEFMAADTVVIGVAFYNFTIASQLKTWIDRILVAGKTFRYPEKGPEGLVGGKRVILAIPRGGFYGPNTPSQAYEHAEAYLRTVLGFIGIRQPEAVVAEGNAMGPHQKELSINTALQKITAFPTAA